MAGPTRTEADAYREQVRVLSQALPAAVSITDALGRVLWVNPHWSKVTGLSFEDSVGRGWSASIHPDDIALIDMSFAAGRERFTSWQADARLHVRSGGWRWFQIRVEPLLGRRGRLNGWISVASDIDGQVRSTQLLKEGEERFRLIAENAPVGLWVADVQGTCVYANALLRRFWGIGPDALGVDWTASAADDEREAVVEAYRAALAGQSSFSVEARHRRADGEIRILATEANPRRDPEGGFLGMIGVNIDVTDARRAEHHHRLLINELNHRVKNTLATVQSLAHQTLRGRDNAGQIGALLEGRLMALSAAHNVLNRENWEAAELGAVVREALRPFEGAGGARLRTRGPPVRIGPQAALAIALTVHELATNAVKYGALSAPEGLVEVEWRLGPGRAAVAFEWRETGGPEVAAPAEQGFGSRLLAGLAFDLGAAADLDFRPEGLVCRLQIPLATPA